MKKTKRFFTTLLLLSAIVSIMAVSAYATSFTNYTTYDANYDFSGSRTWNVEPGTLKITAVFNKGNLTRADSMETTVKASDWDTDYIIYARSHIQTKNHNYYNDYGPETTSSSYAAVSAGLWETTQFAMHYGHFKNGVSNSRYFKGMYYYEDGVGRSTMPTVPDEGEPYCY